MFPVFAVVLGSGPNAAKNTQLIAIDAMGGKGGAYFWSLMHMGIT